MTTPESRPQRRLRTVALLALGPLLGLLGLEIFAQSIDAFWQLDGGRWVPLRTERKLREATPGGTSLFVMGSSVARDVSCAQLELELDRTCTNLSTNGASLVAMAMLAPDVVALAPDTVLLVLGNKSLGPAERDLLRFPFYDLGIVSRIFGPADVLAEIDEHLAAAVSETSVVLRRKDDVRHALLGSQSLLAAGRPVLARRRRINALLEEGSRGNILEFRRKAMSDAELIDRGGSNERALATMQQLLAEAGIEFVVLVAPSHPAVVPENYVPVVGVRLDELEGELGFTRIPGARLGFYESRHFRKGDYVHLNKRGAKRFTRSLAARLSAAGSG